jgi:hypothetical protein
MRLTSRIHNLKIAFTETINFCSILCRIYYTLYIRIAKELAISLLILERENGINFVKPFSRYEWFSVKNNVYYQNS